ncbi:MAG: ABC transporter permease subunit [Vicinamibacterales bacterium]
MSNILALAQKEIRSYFASPIGYVVVGFFALIFGWFFYSILAFFVRASVQMGQMGGPQAVNVNQMMIRPVVLNSTVVMLFVLPMITMRSFAEEKRSGTFELLLTSPISDWQLVLGKFFGALGLVAIMLAVTLVDMGILFVYGNPEWKQIATSYLGFLLLSGCFVAVGLFISSLTRNQIVAAFATFAVFLMLWVANWISDSLGTTGQAILSAISITDHFEDFTKGIIDTKHLAYYVSFIAFGLFLTAKSVDAERWRG